RQERPELAVLQLGNPAFHKLRFLVGRLQLPFGIDESRVMESYRLREDRSFWDSPPFAVQMTYDNLRDAVVDVGVASNVPSKKVAEGKRAERHALSARSAFDFPALDGSRLLFSGYWEDGGETRVGFGFVTVSRRNDLTQCEWIRQQE